jgi:hypothetical protein
VLGPRPFAPTKQYEEYLKEKGKTVIEQVKLSHYLV